MDYKKVLLEKLLDKYEKSKAPYEETNRRIILKMKNVKEYNIENYETKKAFHDSIYELKHDRIINYSWEQYEQRKYIKRNMAWERKYI